MGYQTGGARLLIEWPGLGLLGLQLGDPVFVAGVGGEQLRRRLATGGGTHVLPQGNGLGGIEAGAGHQIGNGTGQDIATVGGAVAGAALAMLTQQNDKVIIGSAVAGAAAGCGMALLYKNRLDKLEQLAREENLKMQLETLQTPGSTPSAAPEQAGIVAQIEDQGMFPVGSATLSSDAMP